jgi:dipeptidyl aminopeptidase/acylaminoacyl peptidase
MNSGPILTTSVALVLTIGACSGTPEPTRSPDQPTPTTSPSVAPASPSGSSPGSPSGRIAFDNHDDVWVIDADGTDLRQLTSSPGHDFDPSWSPDGAQIAFRSERSGDTEIWLMNSDGDGAAATDGRLVASMVAGRLADRLRRTRRRERRPDRHQP